MKGPSLKPLFQSPVKKRKGIKLSFKTGRTIYKVSGTFQIEIQICLKRYKLVQSHYRQSIPVIMYASVSFAPVFVQQHNATQTSREVTTFYFNFKILIRRSKIVMLINVSNKIVTDRLVGWC